jgi:hypothetical protein
MMPKTARLMLLAAILLCGSIVAAHADATSPERCPGYVEHLRSARDHLVRGNRKAAADELRQAQRALVACSRGEAGEGNALTVGPPDRDSPAVS